MPDTQPQPRLPRVVIESPFAAETDEGYTKHVAFAQKCLLDSIGRGEAPYASHLLYPQVLNDLDKDERTLGLRMGWEWGTQADYVVVYTNFGVSEGMARGVEYYMERGLRVEYRTL